MTPKESMASITEIASKSYFNFKLNIQNYEDMGVLRAAVEKGIAEAQFTLASLYRNGTTIKNHKLVKISEPDFFEARKWHEKAAKSGLMESQYALAVFRIKGLAGYKKMPKEGWRIIKQLSKKGFGEASADFAMHQFKLYLTANTQENKDKLLKSVFDYSKKAIDENCTSPEPYNNLGIAYTQGWFGNKNEALGFLYTLEAANRGHQVALFMLCSAAQDEQMPTNIDRKEEAPAPASSVAVTQSSTLAFSANAITAINNSASTSKTIESAKKPEDDNTATYHL